MFHIKSQQGATMEQQEEQKQEISIIKRALLVEDYVPCQRIMSIYLQILGYQVDLVDDSFTAIQKIQSKTYDLIIQDINLHGCRSGKKIIQTIRENKKNMGTPIIVWSAYVNKNNEEKYSLWGADSVLIKACQMPDLEKAIQQCLLTPRYERKFRFQLIVLREKWKRFLNEASRLEWVQFIWNFEFILQEAVTILKEYFQWLDFQQKEE